MHIMVDLETLSTKPNAYIVSIGAVAFDSRGVHDEFYKVIKPTIHDDKFDVEMGTLQWWMDQPDEARKVFSDLHHEPLELVLTRFSQFVEKHLSKDDGVWGNGASFDNVILRNAYDTVGWKDHVPWKFWQDKCYRTIKGMRRDIPLDRIGTHHNAMDDAKSQAFHLINILDKMGIQL